MPSPRPRSSHRPTSRSARRTCASRSASRTRRCVPPAIVSRRFSSPRPRERWRRRRRSVVSLSHASRRPTRDWTDWHKPLSTPPTRPSLPSSPVRSRWRGAPPHLPRPCTRPPLLIGGARRTPPSALACYRLRATACVLPIACCHSDERRGAAKRA